MSAPLQGLEAWGSRCATGVQEIPQRLIVVGGVVACEAATWMSSLGNDVTMLVRGPRLLSAAESFTSRFIEKALAARGITVITDAQVVAAERPQASDTGLGRVHGGPVTVTCAGRTIEADEILVPTGRRPPLLTGMGPKVVGLSPTTSWPAACPTGFTPSATPAARPS